MIYVDVGYLPETAIRKAELPTMCTCPCMNAVDDDKFTIHPPFTDIGYNTSGSMRKEIWESARYLYTKELNTIVQDAARMIDLSVIQNHPLFNGESESSAEMILGSFVNVTKIERKKLLPHDTMILSFTLKSEYKTMAGKEILLKIPLLVNYKSKAYTIMTPGLEVR